MKKNQITGHTRMICLLGSPVAHSISPMMHNRSFELLDLDYAYLAFDIGTKDLASIVESFRKMNVRGFNLTMPDKTEMYPLCDELSDAARLIGAVNTVVHENGKMIGYNTDGIGYMQAVKDAGFDIIGKKMTLLGAGGAATSIAVQAALDGVSELTIFNRKSKTFEHGEEIVRKINEHTNCKAKICDLADWKLLNEELASSAILTNGTSIGMAPKEDACPLPEQVRLPEGLIISDIIYHPGETQLLKKAREHGLPAFNGLHMLLYQGAEAFRLWTGKEMPVEQIKSEYFSNET